MDATVTLYYFKESTNVNTLDDVVDAAENEYSCNSKCFLIKCKQHKISVRRSIWQNFNS